MTGVAYKSEKLHINLDLVFPYLPCGILSIDVEDIQGSHMVNVHKNVEKIALDYNRRPLGATHSDHIKKFDELYTLVKQ